MTRLAVAAVLVCLATAHVRGSDDDRGRARTLVERQAYVMGTRITLAAYADGREAGLAQLEAALAAIEDVERALSTWRPDSEISAFDRSPVGLPWHASLELCALLDEVFAWQQATGGAFDPTVGALAEAWAIHHDGRVPRRAEIEAARARVGVHRIDFHRPSCTLTRHADVTIDVGAFGKGEGLDRAADALRDGSWLVDLGGQVAANGSLPGGRPWTVEIVHPRDRHRPIAQLTMRHGSLSTSGGSERDRVVNGRRIGHLLDPRTGEPATFTGSVVVWHERALLADLLSTALFVMGPQEGLPWADQRGLVAAYLVPDGDDVRVLGTREFTRWQQPLRPAT